MSVETESGQRFTLTSGQQLRLDLKDQIDVQEVVQSVSKTGKETLIDRRPQAVGEVGINWEAPKPIAAEEAERRLEMSPLINGFSTPIDTLNVIKSELGLTDPKKNIFNDDFALEDQDSY